MRSFLTVTLCCAPLAAQWPSNPGLNLAVCDSSGDQAVPKIAAGGDGSTWMAWFDNRGGSYAVYAQKLDAQGQEVFPHNGLLISNQPQSTSLVDWGICSDGAGGVVLAFTDTRVGGDLDVYAYRIDGAGSFLWGANGIALSNNADYEANPKVAALSDGSFVVTWSRTPSSGPGSVHMQKLDPSGVPQFAGQGLEIVGPGTEKPGFSTIVASDFGSWIVAYVRDISTFSSPRHLRTQKYDSAGNPLWNAGAVQSIYEAASMPIAYQPLVIPSDGGGAIFGWHSSVGGLFDCWIQRVDAAGAEIYPHNGLRVSTEASRYKLDPSIAVLGVGGDCLIAFNKRNTGQSQWASCLQRISIGGARLLTDNGIELLPFNGVPKLFERCVPLGNDAVVIACEQTNYPAQGNRVLAFRVDAGGTNLFPSVPAVMSSVLSTKDKPGVVVDATGLVRMVWDDARNDSGDIYAQNLLGDGTLGFADVLPGCFQDGLVNTCPCANRGAAGRGCDNSASSGGARLDASGSVGSDTLVLTASGELPTALTIFLQGSQPAATPAVFGDGVRCAGGSLKRLYVKSASGGSASAPGAGEPSIRTQSSALGDTIPGGATRVYQAYYRDANAAFCPAPQGGTFNISSALSVRWP